MWRGGPLKENELKKRRCVEGVARKKVMPLARGKTKRGLRAQKRNAQGKRSPGQGQNGKRGKTASRCWPQGKMHWVERKKKKVAAGRKKKVASFARAGHITGQEGKSRNSGQNWEINDSTVKKKGEDYPCGGRLRTNPSMHRGKGRQ